ncbi:helix-turn-helix domain-containing protein [Clostridium estertheticum]|uniref:helix-turn-helix domain-containing protein n=1 Tax=Clostridium estertheticum TaxID=238834 RepID=UPI001C0DA1C4|nr:helix-turn-helix domain-containing protein [Clostridium estertheticum]MBU3179351.1 helix-turn-helix domain-containing protein [Clostridium estertheticum]
MAHYNLPHDHGQNTDKILDNMPEVEQFQEVAAMKLSDPAVSHHLRVLRNSGLIVSRRAGKEVYYKLTNNEQANLLHQTIDTMFEISCPTDK